MDDSDDFVDVNPPPNKKVRASGSKLSRGSKTKTTTSDKIVVASKWKGSDLITKLKTLTSLDVVFEK